MNAPCAYDPPGTFAMDAWREELARLVRQGGPEPGEYRSFQRWIETLAEARRDGFVTPAGVQTLLAEGAGALNSTGTLLGHSRVKPYGYPGDFELIDRIYRKWISPDPAFEKWDRFFQSQAAPCAIRGAKAYFMAWLREAESRRHVLADRLELLHIGGGPGRELRDYFLGAPQSRVFVHYVDPDQRAIAHAARLCASVTARISFRQGNPLSLGPEEPPHYIWSFGLFDYLDHSNSVGLLHRLWAQLPPGGELVAGNFSPHSPTKAYLELAGWAVHDRNAAQLAALARGAGVPQSAIRIGREPEGLILFLHLDKPLYNRMVTI